MNKKLKVLASIFTLGMFLTAAGCGGKKEEPAAPAAQEQPADKPAPDGKNPPPAPKDGENPPPAPNGQAPAANPNAVTMKIYYPDEGATHLVAVERSVAVTPDKDKFTAAVEAVIAEPTEPNLAGVFPKATTIKSVSVSGDTATVDFDGSLQRTFSGGSTGEELLVGSLVDTLTEFPEINRVQITIDGANVETLAGHMDLSKPIERMNDLLK